MGFVKTNLTNYDKQIRSTLSNKTWPKRQNGQMYLCVYLWHLPKVLCTNIFVLCTNISVAQCHVYAQDPTNLFQPHKSFIRPQEKDRQRNKQKSFAHLPHCILIVLFVFCSFRAERLQKTLPSFSVFPDAEKATFKNIPE